jgi:ankyrin repeat protein
LHFACNGCHLEVCELLLDRGANPKLATLEGKSTPLHYLAKQDLYPKGMIEPPPEQTETKRRSIGGIKANSIPSLLSNLPTQSDKMDKLNKFLSKLRLTTEKELPLRVLEKMLKGGADINCTNGNSQTPLIISSMHGYRFNAKLFLMKGAFLFEKTK